MRRFLAIALLAIAPLAQAFDSAWTQVATVTLDATYIDEAPPIVPVYLSGFDSTWWAAVQADGDDIRVTEDDDTTEREYYLVSIDTGTSDGLIFVHTDGYASASVNKDLRVFVGNSVASAGSDAAATFADYAAFYLPGMTTVNLANPGTYDLTAVASPGTAASGFEGLTAATYNGSSQYHVTASAPVTAWPITLEALCYSTSNANDQLAAGLMKSSLGSVGTDIAILRMRGNRPGDPVVYTAAGSTGISVESTTGYSTSTWAYAAGSAVSNGSTIVYLNGGNSASGTVNMGANPGVDRFSIGANALSTVQHYLTGQIAFAAASAEVRSANYFATIYDAWFAGAFRTYGATESNGGTTGHPWFYLRYRQ